MFVLKGMVTAIMLALTLGGTVVQPHVAYADAAQAKQVKCLADNIYHEARGEPVEGQMLVGYTVLNRVKDKRWANTICGVVYQKYQFSWTTVKPHPAIKDKDAYKDIYKLAQIMVKDKHKKEMTGVNHYLRCDWRNKVSWWKQMKFVGKEGDHCFYSDK